MNNWKIFSILSITVLLLGITWYVTPNAYADDLSPPIWRGAENSFRAEWTDLTEDSQTVPPDLVSKGPSIFPFFDIRVLGSPTFPPDGYVAICNSTLFDDCRLFLSNFIDDLERKFFRVQVTYTGETPTITSLSANDGTTTPLSPCTLLERQDYPGFYYEDWECIPNPAFEEYLVSSIFFPTTNVKQIVIDTISFDGDDPPLPSGPPVGGTLIRIDSTSLLLVGSQMTASWLIPVIVSAIGIGLVLVRRK